MSRTPATRLAFLGAMLALAVLAAPAVALFEPGAELVSADYQRLEQGDDSTTFAAISADGQYVVMQTRARNFFADDDADPPGQYRAGGVFRYELADRSLEIVADGDLFNEADNAFLRRGASNPAISADGRYIAFATAQSLVAGDGNENIDVYVRDMEAETGSPGAYELASAPDGQGAAAAYGPPPVAVPGSNPGADISRGVSISADGSRVAFRTDVASNLPSGGAASTPAGQVFVRDLATDTTTLVTVTRSGEPAGGALGAAISGDGSAVVWTGANAPAQTRFLNGEPQENSFYYYLWRRIDDGPTAETRRITGISDPDDPACPPSQVTQFDQTTEGPCFGPLTEQESVRSGIISQVPAISADGRQVAFLTGSGPRPLAFTGPGLDLYITDMTPGVSRKAGTVELTRDSATTDTETSAPISGVSMSRSGRYLTITTSRTQFTSDALAASGPSRAVAGVRELYAIDLQEGIIDRVALGYGGEDTDADVGVASSISDDGARVAFTSFAGNLFFGDANKRPDAFVAARAADEGQEPPPPDDDDDPPVVNDNRLLARAKSLGRGRIALSVQVPASGGLKATVEGRVGKQRARRKLATSSGRAQTPGTIELELRVVRRYRKQLKREGRLRGVAELSFVYSLGGERLTDSLRVVFRQKSGRR